MFQIAYCFAFIKKYVLNLFLSSLQFADCVEMYNPGDRFAQCDYSPLIQQTNTAILFCATCYAEIKAYSIQFNYKNILQV